MAASKKVTKASAPADSGPAQEGAPPSKMPVPKVAAAGIGGAVTTLVVWGLQAFGVEVPPEAAVAIGALAAFIAGYLKSEQP